MHLFWWLGWKDIFSVLNLSLRNKIHIKTAEGKIWWLTFTDHWLMNKSLLSLDDITETRMKMRRVRESAHKFVHCNIPSCVVLLVFSALYSWLHTFSSNVILWEWLQFSWMLLFWPLSLLFIISYRRRWGIHAAHLICFTSFLYHREKSQGKCTFWPCVSSPLSLCISSLFYYSTISDLRNHNACY